MDEKKRKDFTDGLDIDQFLEKMSNDPAFMTSAPDGEMSPLVEALQSLKYDEEDPNVCAGNYKTDGNQNFKLGKYKWAIECYDKALNLPVTKSDLKASLFFNRAAANFKLGNYRRVVNDCTEATKIDPKYEKALLKGAQALFELGKYSEAKDWIDRGLVIQGSSQLFQELRKKVAEADKKQQLSARIAKKEEAALRRLLQTIAAHGVTLSPPNPVASDPDSSEISLQSYSDYIAKTPSGSSVKIGEKGEIIWPMRILFPETNQQEFLDQVTEEAATGDVLKILIDENPPPWDEKEFYQSSKDCGVYYSDGGQYSVYEVPKSMSLGTLLKQKHYKTENCLPTVFVLSKKSKFMQECLGRFEKLIRLSS